MKTPRNRNQDPAPGRLDGRVRFFSLIDHRVLDLNPGKVGAGAG
jgi:hypothetical protein